MPWTPRRSLGHLALRYEHLRASLLNQRHNGSQAHGQDLGCQSQACCLTGKDFFVLQGVTSYLLLIFLSMIPNCLLEGHPKGLSNKLSFTMHSCILGHVKGSYNPHVFRVFHVFHDLDVSLFNFDILMSHY